MQEKEKWKEKLQALAGSMTECVRAQENVIYHMQEVLTAFDKEVNKSEGTTEDSIANAVGTENVSMKSPADSGKETV